MGFPMPQFACYATLPLHHGDKLYIFAAGLEKQFPLQSFEAILRNDHLQAAWKGRALSLLVY